MPYIVTTKRAESDDFGGYQRYEEHVVSRRAVATLGDSHLYAMRQVIALMDSGAYDGSGAFMQDAATHPESGGTVGPLPDGTVIEVKRVTAGDLWERLSLGDRLTIDSLDRDLILDAFNAAQEAVV